MISKLWGISSPNLQQAESLQFDLSGIQLSFAAPQANSPLTESDSDEYTQRTFDLSDPKIYWTSTYPNVGKGKAMDPDKQADGFILYRSAYGFRRGLFLAERDNLGANNQGSVLMGACLLKFDSQASLFNEQALQAAVLGELEGHWGPVSHWGRYQENKCLYIAPINWGVKHINGRCWIHFLVQEYGHTGVGTYNWITPITKDSALQFTFSNTVRPTKKLASAYFQFMLDIAKSCDIQYEGSAQRFIEKDSAKNSTPAAPYLPPLPWQDQEVLDEAERKNPFPRH